MYHKILDDAVQELKESEFKELFQKELSQATRVLVQDCVIESDLELIIPEDYVENISERLSLYTQLDNIKDATKLAEFRESVSDRFGPLPQPVEELLESVKLRWQAEKLGFEKVTLKGGKLKGYFVPQDKEDYYKGPVFGQILSFMQMNPRRCRMKEFKGKPMFTIDNINSVTEARNIFKQMVSEA